MYYIKINQLERILLLFAIHSLNIICYSLRGIINRHTENEWVKFNSVMPHISCFMYCPIIQLQPLMMYEPKYRLNVHISTANITYTMTENVIRLREGVS